MLYRIKNRDELEKLEQLASLHIPGEELRLQDKLGKQNIHEVMKNLYEPLFDTIKDTSRDIAKAMTETSSKNNKLLENLNEKLPKLMNDRGILASYLLSP